MGRIPDHLLRLAQRVAEGRWVTIGAKADPKRPGKKKGGTPVELDGEGVIQKGPPALTGKRPSELSQSHLFTGQPHKSQRKLFAEPGDPVPPPRLDPEAKPQAQAPAKKEPKPKAKKPQNMSLLAVIRREGGISGGDFEHADFREHGLLGALNKNGFGIDDMAAMLVRGGHIIVPHGVSSPGDYLLQLLKKKTNSLLADKTSELEKDYEAYARAREEALAHGHESGDLEEVRGRGQEAGADAGTGDILEEIFGPDLGRGGEAGAEEPGDLAGDAAEPASGVDTSFDFGPAAAPKVEDKPKAEPKKAAADKPKGATLQPDGTLKTKDGTVWVRAKAGGEHSPVTDKHYKGGQWMPIHGMSKPKGEKPAEGPVGTQSVEPGEGDKERAEDKGPRMREPRNPATPEDLAQKQKDQEHWDTVKKGPLGRIRGWMGDFPNQRGVKASINSAEWKKLADELGPEKVKQIADEMERRRLDRLARIYDEGKAKGEFGDETKEEFLDGWKKTWDKNDFGLGPRHLAKNPDSARAAKHLYNEMRERENPASLRELNDYLASVQKGAEEPAAPPALDEKPQSSGPKIGDKIKTKLGDRNGEEPQFEIELMASDKPGRVAIGQNGVKQQSIPEESLQHFVDDLTGKVSVTPDSGNEIIDAVARGEAKHLGRGDDGAAYQVGDKVAKVSTVTPFIPTNPGHRTSEEGLARLRQQTETHNKLAEILKEKGIGGVQPLEWHEHGGRGFAVSDMLDTKTKLDAKQVDQVRKAIDALHGAGYTVTDDIQVGLDKNGQPVLYDLGKAQKASQDSLQYDASKFERFAKQNGHEDVLPLRSELERQLHGIKNSTSKYAEKIRAGLREKLSKLDAMDRGQEAQPEGQADKSAKLWDDLKTAQTARQKADQEGDNETYFDADTAVQDAEAALKRLGMDPAKPPAASSKPTPPTAPAPAPVVDQVPPPPKVQPPEPPQKYNQRRGVVNFNPITGPSGHKLTGYNWEHDKVDFVDDRGENRTRKVSAWDRASQADETNRPIVHNFTVEGPDGTTKNVSLETAARLLGFDDSTPEQKAKFQDAVSAAKSLAKLQVERAQVAKEKERWAKDKAEIERQVEALPDDQVEEVPDRMGNSKYRVYRWKNQPEISLRRLVKDPARDREDAKRMLGYALVDDELKKRGHEVTGSFGPNTAKIDAAIKKTQARLDELTKQQPKTEPEPAPSTPTPPPALDLYGNPAPSKPQPATVPGLFGGEVPAEDKKPEPRETVADQAEKGLDWLNQRQDKKTDGTGEMFGGLFSPGRTSGAPADKTPAEMTRQEFLDQMKAKHGWSSPPGAMYRDRAPIDNDRETDWIAQHDNAVMDAALAGGPLHPENQARWEKQTGRKVSKPTEPEAGPVAPPAIEQPKASSLPDRIQNLKNLLNKTRSSANAKALRTAIARLERETEGPVAPPKIETTKPAALSALKPVNLSKIDHPAQAALNSAMKVKKDAQERVNRIRSNPRWNDGSRGRPADLQLEMMQARSAVTNADNRIKAAKQTLERIANEQGMTTKRAVKPAPAVNPAASPPTQPEAPKPAPYTRGVTQERLDSYDPETAVFKYPGRSDWWVTQMNGENFPSPVKTKQQAIQKAQDHKEFMQGYLSDPSGMGIEKDPEELRARNEKKFADAHAKRMAAAQAKAPKKAPEKPQGGPIGSDPRDKIFSKLVAKGVNIRDGVYAIDPKDVPNSLLLKLQTDADRKSFSMRAETDTYSMVPRHEVTKNPHDVGYILKLKKQPATESDRIRAFLREAF